MNSGQRSSTRVLPYRLFQTHLRVSLRPLQIIEPLKPDSSHPAPDSAPLLQLGTGRGIGFLPGTIGSIHPYYDLEICPIEVNNANDHDAA